LAFMALMGAKIYPNFLGWRQLGDPVWRTPERVLVRAHFTRPPPRLR
jgi:hypothetical protein